MLPRRGPPSPKRRLIKSPRLPAMHAAPLLPASALPRPEIPPFSSPDLRCRWDDARRFGTARAVGLALRRSAAPHQVRGDEVGMGRRGWGAAASAPPSCGPGSSPGRRYKVGRRGWRFIGTRSQRSASLTFGAAGMTREGAEWPARLARPSAGQRLRIPRLSGGRHVRGDGWGRGWVGLSPGQRPRIKCGATV
jgi:hypothetical protein